MEARPLRGQPRPALRGARCGVGVEILLVGGMLREHKAAQGFREEVEVWHPPKFRPSSPRQGIRALDASMLAGLFASTALLSAFASYPSSAVSGSLPIGGLILSNPNTEPQIHSSPEARLTQSHPGNNVFSLLREQSWQSCRPEGAGPPAGWSEWPAHALGVSGFGVGVCQVGFWEAAPSIQALARSWPASRA